MKMTKIVFFRIRITLGGSMQLRSKIEKIGRNGKLLY